jgi:hypothetical protein
MRVLSACRVAAVLALLSNPLIAQGGANSSQRSLFNFAANRLTLDAAYSRVWVHNTGAGTEYPMNEATGRLSWRLGQPAITEDAPLRDKLALGVFWTKAPDQQLHSGRIGFSHVGAFAEYMPVGVVGLGYFEPNVSLSVGSFHPDIVDWNRVYPNPLLNYRDNEAAKLGIAPAVGTRVWLFRKIGLRLDAHDLIVHSDKTWFNDPGFSAGLTARF